MSRSRLGLSDYIRELADIRRDIDAQKTRQFIGSNQMIMKLTESSSRWDLSLLPKNLGQSAGGVQWNACIVTAIAKNSNNLVADLAVEFDHNMPIITSIIEIPQPASNSRYKKWFVPIFEYAGNPVRMKFQVIANDEVDLSWREGLE